VDCMHGATGMDPLIEQLRCHGRLRRCPECASVTPAGSLAAPRLSAIPCAMRVEINKDADAWDPGVSHSSRGKATDVGNA
jgi:hypothetical protein